MRVREEKERSFLVAAVRIAVMDYPMQVNLDSRYDPGVKYRCEISFLLGAGKFRDRVIKVRDYNGVPVLASLLPSQNWNKASRSEYHLL